MMKVKICGLFRECDADFVNEARPDYAGLVFWPDSRRFVTDALAAAVSSRLAPGIVPVGVFVNEPPEHIRRLCESGVIRAVQLHGGESENALAKLRALLPGVEIWKAFRVCSAADLAAARASSADRILLDNGRGTGQSFDWSLLNRFGRPYLLAGGLTPENLREAARFRPWGVDLSSGVETAGVKDRKKVLAAVAAARQSLQKE